MRLLVCGGRDFGNNNKECWLVLEQISAVTRSVPIHEPIVIIHGGAKGVDKAAGMWAEEFCECLIYPANWNNYGSAAGPIRNQQMLDEGKPDKVLAINGGRGTADMVRRAKKAGIPVIEVRYHPS